MKNADGICKKILLMSLVVAWPAGIAFGQPQSDAAQSSQQSQAPPEQKKTQPATDAAKKPEKDKPKSKKVYTEEDLAGMRGNGVSVVGDDKPAGGGTGASGSAGKTKAGVVPMSGQDEEYWRGKARPLLDRIAATDQQIAKLQDDIKKYGAGGFDVTTGRKDNVAYINDRNGQVQELEKRKAGLEKQLDELQDEGRKAGASPAWFR